MAYDLEVRLRSRSTGFYVFAYALSAVGCSAFFPSNNLQPPSTTVWTVHAIRVNSVGYLPAREKIATVVPPAGGPPLTGAPAQVWTAAGSLQWTCQLTGPMTDPDSNVSYYLADFTEFTEPGTYYLAVPSLGTGASAQSAPFEISDSVFGDALERAMIGMYGQRCGTAVSITLGADTWSHAACHQNDGYLKYLTGADTSSPSVGGWHDAGDYGKYVTNGAFTVGMLLEAFEHFGPTLSALTLPIPESGTKAAGGGVPLPDFLWEVKWELDWLLTTQQPSGGVPHKLTALQFESFIMPDKDNSMRYFAGIGTAATGDFVAAMAAAARIYKPYAPVDAQKYLAAAQLGWSYLAANAGPPVPADDDPSNAPPVLVFTTGHYGQSSDLSNRTWAAAELWETTGDATALAAFETNAKSGGVDVNFDWDNVENLGFFTYLRSTQAGRDPAVVARLTTSLVSSADTLKAAADGAAFGRDLNGYWWGSNGAVARTAMNLWVANQLMPDSTGGYLDTIAKSLDHLLGRNDYDRSQVTDVGYHPPVNPHHRPSASDGIADPWPGLLVGGANATSTTPIGSDTDWVDVQADAEVNEIAINWVAAFVYATAALTPAPM
jgi:endoglucanase